MPDTQLTPPIPAAPTTAPAPAAKPASIIEPVILYGRTIETKSKAGAWETGDFTKLQMGDVFRFRTDTTEWTVRSRRSDTELLASHS